MITVQFLIITLHLFSLSTMDSWLLLALPTICSVVVILTDGSRHLGSVDSKRSQPKNRRLAWCFADTAHCRMQTSRRFLLCCGQNETHAADVFRIVFESQQIRHSEQHAFYSIYSHFIIHKTIYISHWIQFILYSLYVE